MYPKKPKKYPMLRAGNTVRQDLRELDKLDRNRPVPPMAELTIDQMAEVERLAGLRINLAQIGVHLRIEDETWQEIVRVNPAVVSVYRAGAVRTTIVAAETVQTSIEEGDANLAMRYLEKHGGPQWAPAAQRVITEAAGPLLEAAGALDVLESVGASLDRQRMLLEQQVTIENEAEEEKKDG